MKSNMAFKMAAKLENIKILQLWFYPNKDGSRIFFWFNAASIMGVYLENEYFTWY